MASYNADINVNVNVFDRKLRELERRLQALDKIANPKKPLTKAQAAEQIPKLKEEIELNKRAKKLLDDRQEAQAKLKKAFRDQVRLRKEELSYEQRSLRLSNARKLQEARLAALERAGAFEGKGRSAEISGLLRKRDQFSQIPAIQERVATALGRILTLQKAINRADIKNIGQKQRIDDYNKRIEALRRVGVSEGKLRNVIKRRSEFTTAADKRQDVIADKRERQLKRELQLLERKNRLALKAFNTEAKIQSTPLSRAPKRTVLGTPEAEAKKAAFYAEKSIQDAKELDRQERLINKTLDDQRKLREKNAKAAKRLAEQQLRDAKRLGGPRSALPPRTILGSDEAIRQKYEYYQKIGKTIKAVSSTLPPRSVLGSDEAIRQKYEYYQKIGKTIKAASSPIRGTATMVGSPKFLEAQASDQLKLEKALLELKTRGVSALDDQLKVRLNIINAANRETQLQKNTRSSERIANRSAILEKVNNQAEKYLGIQAGSVRKELILQKIQETRTALSKDQFRLADSLTKETDKLLRKEERRLLINKKAVKFRREAAEVASQARTRRRKEALGSAIIGGAFPLLFGEGIGAAVGGGAGGAAGGLVGGQFGFGLSLVGTALGSSFDALAKDAAELGAALDSVTGDANAVAKAAGLTGTDLGRLIENLEQAGDRTQAMALATRELEEIVGEQGVRALRDFSATAEQMGRDLEVLATRIKALFAGIANVVFPPETTKRLEETKAIERARKSADPKIQQAVKDYFNESNFEGLGLKEGVDARLAARQKILDLVKQEQDEMLRIRSLTEDVAQKEREKTAENETSLSIARARLVVEKNNGDILNATVEASLRAIAAEETRLKLVQAAGDARLIELALIEAGTRKAEIDNQILAAREALSRKVARTEGKAAESKAPSLQRDILRERLNLFNVDEQIARVGLDRLDILRREEEAILARRDTEIKLLELARQDALNNNKVKADEALINELYDARISKINKTAALAKEENSALIQRITLERELTKLAGERETEDIGIDLKRQVEAVNRRISNPFGGQDSEMLELRIQQVQRQEDAYRALDRQIADVNRRLEDAPDNVDLKQELGLLEGRKRKYAELLPILDQVEQKELRLQQTLQQLQPLTNALSQGLTDLFTGLIDGSKSAQEVFADMLKNMGQALIQQGAVMITQYIAIGIARAFGLGQSPSIGTRASDFNLPGFGNLESTGGNVFAGFTRRANGGPVSTGTPYMVGERGPELFVPSNSGTIVPNNALGGDVNVVVNVTETQTDTRGNGARANQVGNALAAAVQAEIIKQKRPGGLLAN